MDVESRSRFISLNAHCYRLGKLFSLYLVAFRIVGSAHPVYKTFVTSDSIFPNRTTQDCFEILQSILIVFTIIATQYNLPMQIEILHPAQTI